ncbi:MAG: hypothetical protein R3315_01165 [Woeseiaceae bacterium]|nr:hypothetical protein [Woeseiaceae bacterium]
MEPLKQDLFGEIRREMRGQESVIVRDCSAAHPLVRWFARRLLAREAGALALLESIPQTPDVVDVSRDRLVRTWIDGRPLQVARSRDPDFYRQAMRLLRGIHAAGVVHNDLAKEPNLLVDAAGQPAIIDFQIALFPRRRHRLFRLLGREDLRHMLKHKRTYCPQHLTARERAILATPSLLSRVLRQTFKPVYYFVTRRLLGWADREGAGPREAGRKSQ